MTDTDGTTAGAATRNDDRNTDEPTQVKMNVLAQYVRDMSFENILVQKGMSGEPQPNISVQVNLDARKRQTEHQYEIILKLNVTSKSKSTEDVFFLMELEYAGVFHIESVPEAQLHPFLMIECPRILFPFARRIVSDVTRDGGFPPVNLEPIDFVALYRNELLRRQAAQAQESPTPPN